MKQLGFPAYERPIPARPWLACAVLALTLAAGGIGLWEWAMRGLGLEPGDLGDGQGHWAEERRRVGVSDEGLVVIVGASRILFATDLAGCLLYTSPSPRDKRQSRMPSSA